METYAQDGNVFGLLRQHARGDWMPAMGECTPRLVFLTLGQHRHFDRLPGPGQGAGSQRNSWYERWAEAALGREMLLASGMARDLYLVAIDALVAAGALVRTGGTFGDAITLSPDALVLHTNLLMLTMPVGKRQQAVSEDAAAALPDMPCKDATHEHYTDQAPARGWQIDSSEAT